MSYKNGPIPEYDDPFFQQRYMKEGRNRNMAAQIDPLRVSVICPQDTQPRISRYQTLKSEWELTYCEGAAQDGIQHQAPAHVTILHLLKDVLHEVHQLFCHPWDQKRLKPQVVLGEYFCVIGCRLIGACYVGHYDRELFPKDIIKPKKLVSSASIKSFQVGTLRRSPRPCPTKMVQFLSMMTHSSNSGIWRRGGTETWQHKLTHYGSVL